MARRFIDLWIRPSIEEAEELIKKLVELGYSGAASEFRGEEEWGRLREIAERFGLKLYRKLVIEAKSRKELLCKLRANRGCYEVISVICKNLETTLVAARDSRVDTLIIPPEHRYRIDKGVAVLLRNRVEIPFKWFLEKGGREKFLTTALEIVRVLGRKNGIIVSSCAETALELRGARQLASLLEVLGLNSERALDSVSKEPYRIIETNLKKLSPNYIARGVVKTG